MYLIAFNIYLKDLLTKNRKTLKFMSKIPMNSIVLLKFSKFFEKNIFHLLILLTNVLLKTEKLLLFHLKNRQKALKLDKQHFL